MIHLWERDLFVRSICGTIKIYSGTICTDYGKLIYKKIVKNDKNIVFSIKDWDWFRDVLLRQVKETREESKKKFKFIPPCCFKNYIIEKTLLGEKTIIEVTAEERSELLQSMFCDTSQHYDFYKYKTIETRLKSFVNWQNTYVSVNDLANAGFYYTKVNDVVRCFTCGGLVYDWEPGDDPLKEHKKFFPCCNFIREKTVEKIGEDVCGTGNEYVRGNIGRDATPPYVNGNDVAW